jgi:choloylglycine hydrolase
MIKTIFIALLTIIFLKPINSRACSIIYYVDKRTGKIYVANNEDYWYDVKPYVEIIPKSKNKLARLWYGWNNLAQGGINEAGLFFDGATTPEQKTPNGYVTKYNGNLGDELLASCKTVNDAINFLEQKKIAISEGHVMFGDRSGNASIIEWVHGEKRIIPIVDNKLVMTNFLLSDTGAGNFPCERYNSINENIRLFENNRDTMSLAKLRVVARKAVQLPKANNAGRQVATLYSTFINISDMQFVLVSKLDDTKPIELNLNSEFKKNKKNIIKLR